MGEDDVGGEQGGVREGERHADRLADEPDVGQEVDASGGRNDGGDVASYPGPIAASTMGPMNSIAATVASGRRSIEM